MRRKLVVGNWKMNLHWNEALSLIAEIVDFGLDLKLKNTGVAICPPTIYLRHAYELIKSRNSTLALGAQNCSKFDNGAYTGEISATMLKELGLETVIIGHSERRQYFDETNEVLREKMKAALKADLHVIYCCGETLNERESGSHFDVIKAQLEEGICKITATEIREWVVAYEPVWAIGTGHSATAAQAQEMHAFIRSCLAQYFGEETAQCIQILYGGSVNPTNARSLFSQPDVDGGLIGGAALTADSFKAIVLATEE